MATTVKTIKTKSHDGFVYTTAIRRLRQLKKRIRVIPGGTSAGVYPPMFA